MANPIHHEKTFAESIAEQGGRLYRVGGCVRDACLGITVHDIDYCIVGLANSQVDQILQGKSKVGSNFSIYRHYMKVDGKRQLVDIALAQRASEGKAQSCVSPTVSLEEDLYRRDFTINAMAIDVLTGALIDPFQGQQDLALHNIRHVSDAFAEDPLRVYRAARFAARFGFTVDQTTLGLMHTLKKQLYDIAPQRLYLEIQKVFRESKPSVFFRTLALADVLDVHFAEVNRLREITWKTIENKQTPGQKTTANHAPDQYVQPVGNSHTTDQQRDASIFEHTMRTIDAASLLTKNYHDFTRHSVLWTALVHEINRVNDSLCMTEIEAKETDTSMVQMMCKRLEIPKKITEAIVIGTKYHAYMLHLPYVQESTIIDLIKGKPAVLQKSPDGHVILDEQGCATWLAKGTKGVLDTIGATGMSLFATADQFAQTNAVSENEDTIPPYIYQSFWIQVVDTICNMSPGDEERELFKKNIDRKWFSHKREVKYLENEFVHKKIQEKQIEMIKQLKQTWINTY